MAEPSHGDDGDEQLAQEQEASVYAKVVLAREAQRLVVHVLVVQRLVALVKVV
jgi:hypothetical protein